MSETPARVIARRVAWTHEMILRVTGDLSDEQLTGRQAPNAPPIGWHLWHIARWADRLQVTIPRMTAELGRRLGPGRELWEAEGMAASWGFTPDTLGYGETGTGMGDESNRLPLPEKELLVDYARRAFAGAERALSAVDDLEFAQSCPDLYIPRGGETSVGSEITAHLSHATRHLGMIEALRGLLGISGSATI